MSFTGYVRVIAQLVVRVKRGCNDAVSRNTKVEMYRCTLGEAFGYVPRSTALRRLSLLNHVKGCNDQDADCLLSNTCSFVLFVCSQSAA